MLENVLTFFFAKALICYRVLQVSDWIQSGECAWNPSNKIRHHLLKFYVSLRLLSFRQPCWLPFVTINNLFNFKSLFVYLSVCIYLLSFVLFPFCLSLLFSSFFFFSVFFFLSTFIYLSFFLFLSFFFLSFFLPICLCFSDGLSLFYFLFLFLEVFISIVSVRSTFIPLAASSFQFHLSACFMVVFLRASSLTLAQQ